MRRGFWFAAGVGTSVYVMFRARRAAEMFTPEGLRDRVAGLGVGAHLFAEEVRTGMAERETELRERLGLGVDGTLQLESRDRTDRLETMAGVRPTTETLEGTH